MAGDTPADDPRSAPEVVILAALRWEVAPVLAALTRVRRDDPGGVRSWVGLGGGRVIRVVQTGMGAGRVRHAAVSLAPEFARARWIMSTGCAGGLGPRLGPGALVVASQMVDAAGIARRRIFQGPAERLQRWAEAHGLSLTLGGFCSVDAPLLGAGAKRAAHERSGAIVVEMEGAAVAEVAEHHGKGFVAVRAVLDPADMTIPDIGSGGGIGRAIGSLVGDLLSRPRELTREVARLRAARLATIEALTRFFRTFTGGGGVRALDGVGAMPAPTPDR